MNISTKTTKQQKYALEAHNRLVDVIKNGPKDDKFVKANQHLLTEPFNPEITFSAMVILAGFYDWSITINIMNALEGKDIMLHHSGSGFLFGTGETTVYGVFNIPMEELIHMPCQFDFAVIAGGDGGAVLTLVNASNGKVIATLAGPAAGLALGAVNGVGIFRQM